MYNPPWNYHFSPEYRPGAPPQKDIHLNQPWIFQGRKCDVSPRLGSRIHPGTWRPRSSSCFGHVWREYLGQCEVLDPQRGPRLGPGGWVEISVYYKMRSTIRSYKKTTFSCICISNWDVLRLFLYIFFEICSSNTLVVKHWPVYLIVNFHVIFWKAKKHVFDLQCYIERLFLFVDFSKTSIAVSGSLNRW